MNMALISNGSELIAVERYHDFSAGHRVVGHENKCRGLHGHNYRVYFTCSALESHTPLDTVGRVIDFGVIKEKLCAWVETHWDHKMLLWDQDPLLASFQGLVRTEEGDNAILDALESVQPVPFNPTAENMALFLLNIVGNTELVGTGVRLLRIKLEETRKCSATVLRGTYVWDQPKPDSSRV
jgi:6-pyruvoyltetrahydropterin/6-carboxytetrahydropterin synthase